MMIRKRFLPLRGVKIIAWTVAGVAWVTAAIAGRVAATPTHTAATDPATQVVESNQQSGVPALPQNGLVVIQTAPSTQAQQQAQPQQIVRRVIQVAPPVRQRSSGS
jgi:hypothetical protein